MSNTPCHKLQVTRIAPAPEQGKMSPKVLVRQALTIPGKVPLRSILVVPFVLQIFGAVALTGSLSLRIEQKLAINEVTLQLRGEISARIEQKLKNYLEVPRVIAEINTDGIELDRLNTEDTGS